MVNKIKIAEYALTGLKRHLLTTKAERYKQVLYFFTDPKNNLDISTDLSKLEKKLSLLFNIKGPFIQLLSPSKMGMKWKVICKELGFSERLLNVFPYEKVFLHQEQAFKAIKNNHNVILTASTGRGKTESWLLPILDKLCKEKVKLKIGENNFSPQAIFIYPTKALAFDQYRRIANILSKVNKGIEKDAHITIGIYDADTPFNWAKSRKISLDLLCPSFDENSEICKSCNKILGIDKNRKTAILPARRPGECKIDLDLSFIKLTRVDIEQGVDIILTNPDFLNNRLVNINSNQQGFVASNLRYLVLDEVHLYSGIFGAYVSNILKRLKQLQKKYNPAVNMQIIGASATISKALDTFQTMVGIKNKSDIIHIKEKLIEDFSEKHRKLKEKELLRLLVSSYLGETTLINCLHNKYLAAEEQSETLDEEEKEFTGLIYEDIDTSILSWMDFLEKGLLSFLSISIVKKTYEQLKNKQKEGVLLTLEIIYDVVKDLFTTEDKDIIDRFINNFFTVGSIFGIVERRIHIFLWPMNELYRCAKCFRIYKEPVEKCICGSRWIFPIVSDSKNQQLFLRGNYCSTCNFIFHSTDLIDIGPVFEEETNCPICNKPSLSVYWSPSLYCEKCNEEVQPLQCYKCAHPLTFTDMGIQCTNPACNFFMDFGDYNSSLNTCFKCNAELTSLNKFKIIEKTSGLEVSEIEENVSYLAVVVPVWRNFRSGLLIRSSDINRDNTSKLILEGLVATSGKLIYKICNDCSKSFIPNLLYSSMCPICGSKDLSTSYMQMSSKPELGNFILNKGVMKFERLSKSTLKNFLEKDENSLNKSILHLQQKLGGQKRDPDGYFVKFFSTPTTLTNSLTQYLLRADYSTKSKTDFQKYLSYPKSILFADSYRDVNNHTDNLIDSEMHIYIRNRLLKEIEQPKTLLDLIYNLAENEFDSKPSKGKQRAREMFNHMFETSLRETNINKHVGFIKSHFIPGTYPDLSKFSKGFTKYGNGFFVSQGLVNVRLLCDFDNNLEKVVVRLILEEGSIDTYQLYEKLSKKYNKKLKGLIDLSGKRPTKEYRDFIDLLEEKSLIRKTASEYVDPYVSINDKLIECYLVNEDNPIAYQISTDEFIPEWKFQTSIIENEFEDIVQFKTSIFQRNQITSRWYNYYANLYTFTPQFMLYTSTYRGDFTPEKRKLIERYFRRGEINIICSTSALEVGIDIGDLDYISLYGTPPNINAYLQRIGRAGRRTKSSIIVSVSKRNPIDYYYYWYPSRLIYSEPEKIPLNSHNANVLINNIYWAMLDFVAYKTIFNLYLSNNRIDIDTPSFKIRKNPIEKGLIVYHTLIRQYTANQLRMDKLDGKKQVRIMNLFYTFFEDHEEEFKTWLQEMYDYNYCSVCGYISESKSCCSTETTSAHSLINKLYPQAKKLFYDSVFAIPKVEKELKTQIEESMNLFNADDSGQLLQTDFISELMKKMKNLSVGYPYLTILKSLSAAYDFSIRSTDNPVIIELPSVGRDEPEITDRDRKMAIKELYPGAIYNYFFKKYVVTKVEFDKEKNITSKYCDDCQKFFPEDYSVCPICQNALEEKNVYSLKISQLNQIDDKKYDVQSIYQDSSERNYAKETLAIPINFVANVSEFEENIIKRVFLFIKDRLIGEIQFGPLDVVSVVSNFYVKYSKSLTRPQPIKICRFQECNSPVTYAGEESCLSSKNHPKTFFKEIDIGDKISTFGIRLNLTNDNIHLPREFGHTLAHGLRSTFQKLSGIDIREIEEYVDKPNDIFLYDSTPGGNGVIEGLFTYRDGKYVKLEEMKKIMLTLAQECNCLEACPSCFMQIFCSIDNGLLSRKVVLNLVKDLQFSDEPRIRGD
ncbi:MAG: DEAD/DEAH box helicase [Candidatus Heimdallarchaeaceae archaeon]